MRRIIIPLATTFALALAGCSDSPSVEQCEELLSHIVEIEVKSAADDVPAGARAEDLEQQKTEIEEYLGEEFVETCRETYSGERVSCALSAGSYEELAACDES